MRAIALLTLLSMGTPYSSPAAVPDPTKSHFDPILVGNSSGRDMGNAFHGISRDAGNDPQPGKTITIHFFTSPARPYLEQEPGTTVDCVGHVISRITGGDGEAIFHARLGAFDQSGIVQVRSNGVRLGTIQVRSTDLDGDGVTGLRDVNAFRERFVFHRVAPETDLNQGGVTNGFDFDLLRAEFVARGRGTVCP